MRPTPHLFISLAAVIERRHQYRIVLRVTTPIVLLHVVAVTSFSPVSNVKIQT